MMLHRRSTLVLAPLVAGHRHSGHGGQPEHECPAVASSSARRFASAAGPGWRSSMRGRPDNSTATRNDPPRYSVTVAFPAPGPTCSRVHSPTRAGNRISLISTPRLSAETVAPPPLVDDSCPCHCSWWEIERLWAVAAVTPVLPEGVPRSGTVTQGIDALEPALGIEPRTC
jgi:hypothetical protein